MYTEQCIDMLPEHVESIVTILRDMLPFGKQEVLLLTELEGFRYRTYGHIYTLVDITYSQETKEAGYYDITLWMNGGHVSIDTYTSESNAPRFTFQENGWVTIQTTLGEKRTYTLIPVCMQ